MKRFLGCMLAIMILTVLVTSVLAETNGRTMYVYTKNGKKLLVRSSMSTTEDNIVGSLPYGASVVTFGSPKPGWTYIEYGKSGQHYVMTRYLVKTKPAPLSSTGKPAPASRDFDTRSATTVVQINKLLASAKTVTPYTVTIRPTRASGWVYMRWLPTRNSNQMASFSADYELTVLAELKDWYQVQDPATGKVGFVYKGFAH